MIITNSMVKLYQRCPRAFWYKFQQNLLPKRAGKDLPLKRGKWLHELLEVMYQGEDWRKRHKQLSKEFNRMFEEERIYYGDLPTHCFRIMRAYEHYWREDDKQLRMVVVEGQYDVPLPHGHTFRFRVDGIAEDDYGLWLFESKSHKRIPDSDYRFMDPQTARYFWALEKEGFLLNGVIWNYMSTLNLSKPVLTQGGRLSRRKIRSDPWTFAEGVQDLGLDPRDYRDDILTVKRRLPTLYRRERVPKPPLVSEQLVKEMVWIADEIEAGFKPIRNITQMCEKQCEYMNLCITSLYGGDTKDMAKSQYRRATSGDYYAFQDEPSL